MAPVLILKTAFKTVLKTEKPKNRSDRIKTPNKTGVLMELKTCKYVFNTCLPPVEDRSGSRHLTYAAMKTAPPPIGSK